MIPFSNKLTWSFFCVLSLIDGYGVIAAGASQTTANTSSRGSNLSRNSQFSAASGSSDDAFPNGQILPHPNLRIYALSELRAATKNFRADTVLGEGGFGKVFKGWLDEKVPKGSSGVIAVKKLNSESMQGFEEWQVNQIGYGILFFLFGNFICLNCSDIVHLLLILMTLI